jgi:hypothetical protein
MSEVRKIAEEKVVPPPHRITAQNLKEMPLTMLSFILSCSLYTFFPFCFAFWYSWPNFGSSGPPDADEENNAILDVIIMHDYDDDRRFQDGSHTNSHMCEIWSIM